jgi:hypothetical protein
MPKAKSSRNPRRAAAPYAPRKQVKKGARKRVTKPGAPSRTQRVSVPAAMGSVLSSSNFAFSGPAQKLADQDHAGSLRVVGTDLYSIALQADSAGAGTFTASTIGPYWAPLSPSTVSARMQAVEEMFQWYCIRRLRVTYLPGVATSTSGQIALGYSTDWNLQTLIPVPTVQQVLEFKPSLLTPVWQAASMLITNDGTKLYECYLSSDEPTNRFQGIFCGQTVNTGVASEFYGFMRLEYVVDFYQPTPILSSVDRARRMLAHASRPLATRPLRAESKEPRAELPDIEDLSSTPPVKLLRTPKIVVEQDEIDCLEVVTPSKFRPTPSMVPGGVLYAPGTTSLVPTKVPSKK